MTVETRVPVDLVDKIVEAAEAAIRNEAPSLAYDQHRVKGVHIELEVANGGAMIDGRAWIEQQVKSRRDRR